MTRTHLLTLRAELVRMREAGEPFDYRNNSPECGCVVPVARRLFGAFMGVIGFDLADESYLVGGQRPDRDQLTHKHYNQMTPDEARDHAGLTEAIRRVEVVLARYPEERA